jgi:TonB family protein
MRPVSFLICVGLLNVSALGLMAARVNPKPVTVVPPGYPESMAAELKAGTAVVEVEVGIDGRVHDPKLKSTDDPAFGEAALAAIQQWVFEPARNDGEPFAIRVSIPFQFKPSMTQQLNHALGRAVFVELPSEPVSIKSLDHQLKAVDGVAPIYPKSKLGSGEEPVITVNFVVGPDGSCLNPEVMGDAAQDFILPVYVTISRLRFSAPTVKGKPVYVKMVQSLHFTEKQPEARKPRTGK